MLHQRVGAHLHKTVIAPSLNHLCHHFVESNAIRCGMCRWDLSLIYTVHYRRNQSRLITQFAEHPIKQRSRCSFAIGPCDTDQFEMTARIAIKG